MEINPLLALRYLAGKIDEYVKQAGRDTIMLNGRADKARKRYARIPDGDACPFCKMLGSRGFVYRSEESAGGGWNTYHPHCNCQIAVSFEPGNYRVVSSGGDGSLAARGYDPQALYREYIEAGRGFKPAKSTVFAQAAKGRAYGMKPKEPNIGLKVAQYEEVVARVPNISSKKVKELSASLERTVNQLFRDIKRTGNYASVMDRYLSALSGDGVLTSQWWARPKGREVLIGSWLSQAGFDVEFIRDFGIKGRHYPDMRINGELWEMKSPETSNITKIRARIAEGKHQAQNVIVDLTSNDHYSDEMLQGIVGMLDDPLIEQIMVIRDGNVTIYK